jgi:putative DNA primase/helicase
MILGDETPENLAWSLARIWPSSGVMTSEAGTVLGSHGMGKDSIMRSLALWNTLWDGKDHHVGRRTSESFTVRGARLTVALGIQETTLREFMDKSRGLARGIGLFARFLMAWPESTIGNRPFRESENYPHLDAFHVRLTEILNQKAPIGADGTLSPALLAFTPEAKAAWVAFYNTIEAELQDGGELHEVKDVASKIADNAARMAALFHVFGKGMGGISLECVVSACQIVTWHLSESRRFFSETAQSKEIADALKLESWLLRYCRKQETHMVGKSHVIQCGPNPLRDKKRLDAAITELEALERLRVLQEGRRITLQINPALLEEAS